MDRRSGSPTPQRALETPQRSTRSLLPPRPGDAPALPRRRRAQFGDRYIPNRLGVDLQAAFSLQHQERVPNLRHDALEIELRKEAEANRTFSTVLKAELFGDNVPESGATTPPRTTPSTATTPRLNLFSYLLPSLRPASRDQQDLFSLLPVRQELQRLLLLPQKKPRSISKVPYRVLDAPELSDDFYLNLVDWGLQDALAVGLGDSVYLWEGLTQSVERLCVLDKDKVTLLSWIGAGTHLAVGTLKGLVEIWDATKTKCVRTMTGHKLRVSCLAWNEHVLLLGLRDRLIYNRDVRLPSHYINSLEAHRQEVCGLRWNVEENKLALGGNDNSLYVWDGLSTQPLHHFSEHTAAVKALAWLPHQRGVLALGGGTADKTIKIWNTITGARTANVETGSQVCNLLWLRNLNELVSTHGYLRNQIIVWKYPLMQQIAHLTGHTYRVLYLLLLPDGETIVTGAGDETLRFWNVFEKNRGDEPPSLVLLDAFTRLR